MKPTSDNLPRMWIVLAMVALPLASFADLSVAQLRAALDAKQKITIVDVRLTPHYSKGHIPNAINLPASLIPAKRLPPLGRVVVYSDGLGVDDPSAAVEALNAKAGITAELLVGGYRAWKAAGAPTTERAGLNPVVNDRISYQDLQGLDPAAAVLVDLRTPPRANPKSAEGTAEPLTDLADEFPGRRVVRDPFTVHGNAQNKRPATSPLLVLIDNGDGRAEKMYRALRSNGNFHVVILTGGEGIVKRRGRAGSKRIGHGLKTPGGEVPRAGGGR